ncbi:MAG: hypothetical protein U5R31_00525 [Acidimicrobiia bacterium]|nr:hypothetical protein [Acidimicrobiia bacterium]
MQWEAVMDSTGGRYLVYRRDVDLRNLEAVDLEGLVYFQLWKTRQSPFGELADGDTAYWVYLPDKTLHWEFRVRELLAQPYGQPDEVFRALRNAYGLYPEHVNDYVWGKPEGWLLAWAVEVVGPVDASLPDIDFGELGTRNGYVPFEKLGASTVEALDLPPLGRAAAVEVPPFFDASRAASDSIDVVPDRYIPVETRGRVPAA